MDPQISYPKISFGIIVLNGEPFLRYNLKALYPFAHEIIVVEGAAHSAKAIATNEGHSTDDTLEILQVFKAENDPENKLKIVTAEDEGYPNGFWPGEKLEQSQAYVKRASGDYIWQVDIDEFYRPLHMAYVLEMLKEKPSITAVSFELITFWGSFDYIVDGWYLRRVMETHRIFKWGAGFIYASHRPPTVYDESGRNLRELVWVSGHDLANQGVFMYHYSLLFPKQVKEKSQYYGQANWAKRKDDRIWAREGYFKLKKPYRVHNVSNYPSWLERYQGDHPPQIEEMKNDIDKGVLDVELRPIDDVEDLLDSLFYHLGRWFLRLLIPVERIWRETLKPFGAKCKQSIKNTFPS